MQATTQRGFIRTAADHSVYTDTITSQENDRQMRITLHMPILKRKYKKLEPLQNQLYSFPISHREKRMTEKQFYQGFGCSGEKNLRIISNFFYDYLERKQRNKENKFKVIQQVQPKSPKPKTIRSKKYRQKYRSLIVNPKPPIPSKPTTLENLRQTLMWKKKFLAQVETRQQNIQ